VTGSGAADMTDRRGLRALGFDACMERLRGAPVGRLAFVHDGESVILPVNHAVDGVSVVFRTQHGSKLEVAAAAGNVAYEVDGYDPATQTGWSVVLKGTAEVVYDDDETARCEALGLRSWADVEGRGTWVRVRPVEVSGRDFGG
jgi:uncharacterized protein